MSLSDTDITNKNINIINDKIENKEENTNDTIEEEQSVEEEENTNTTIEEEQSVEEETKNITIENEESIEEGSIKEETETITIENKSINIKLNNDDLENKQLSLFQKQIITKIFNNALEVLKELINKPNLNDMLVITITITNLANLVETIKITNNKGVYSKLSGNDKRKIVLFIGELILSKIISIKNKDRVI